MKDYDKYVLKGLLASGLLLAFYFVVSSLLGGVSFALDNFVKLWYWMTPLVVGFGVQIGMFFYVKDEMHRKATTQAAASTGMSATSMVACCAHHIADIAPFLGISALGLFLTKYQSTFLLAGIFSNMLGITYMYSLINTKISRARIKTLLYSLLVLSVIIVFVSYYSISKPGSSISLQQNNNKASFQALTSNENNVEFQVTPLSPNEFEIVMNTHSVDLDFDLAKISMLYDDIGNEYEPLGWGGAEPGGHHIEGILKFPQINSNAKLIKLVIIDSTRREFSWNIK